ncbi:MAG: histidine phosphatase family protein [Acidimicrobiales bacterium]
MAEPRRFPQIRFSAPPGASVLVLVRHGESEPAVEGEPFPLLQGRGDPSLAPEGIWQADKLAERLARERVDAIYVTPLRRTGQTAAPLVAATGIEPRLEPDLQEVNLGQWEGGLYRQKVREGDPVALAMFEAERYDIIPGAEPAEQFSERVRRGIERIAGAHVGQRVVVVSHGGVIGEALAQAAHARPFAFVGTDNASVSELVVMPGRWMIRRYNDVSHLAVHDEDVPDLSPAP